MTKIFWFSILNEFLIIYFEGMIQKLDNDVKKCKTEMQSVIKMIWIKFRYTALTWASNRMLKNKGLLHLGSNFGSEIWCLEIDIEHVSNLLQFRFRKRCLWWCVVKVKFDVPLAPPPFHWKRNAICLKWFWLIINFDASSKSTFYNRSLCAIVMDSFFPKAWIDLHIIFAINHSKEIGTWLREIWSANMLCMSS